ncbi:hypothetical protein PVAP13_3NG140717 [Panicum virgatum]|uniref:Uncharacterized protein n=1 Tax=Panicum virgatum TaxID=38727 RepID=A0A8T0U9K8_PANVG|nr:hypothetical protein PVAP13_3NG140717 [Panicum virgatum]
MPPLLPPPVCGARRRPLPRRLPQELAAAAEVAAPWSSWPPPLELANSALAAALRVRGLRGRRPWLAASSARSRAGGTAEQGPHPVGAAGRIGGGGASSWTSWSTPAPPGSALEAAGRRPSSSRGASRRRAAAAGTTAREGAALLLFYAVALAEASLFLFEKAYRTWKVSVRKLLRQVSAECKLGAYGLVSLTRSVSPASTRLDLAPRLCYALRRWAGSDARPRRAATCTTAALSASCRARTTAASPPRAAPHAAAAPRRRAWLRQPRRAPPTAVGSRRRPRLRRPRSRPVTPTSSPLRSPSSSSAGHGRAPPPPAAPPAAIVPRPLPAPCASPRRGPSARPEWAPPLLGRRPPASRRWTPPPRRRRRWRGTTGGPRPRARRRRGDGPRRRGSSLLELHAVPQHLELRGSAPLSGPRLRGSGPRRWLRHRASSRAAGAAVPCCALLGRPWRPVARRGRRAACVVALPPHYLSLKDAKDHDPFPGLPALIHTLYLILYLSSQLTDPHVIHYIIFYPTHPHYPVDSTLSLPPPLSLPRAAATPSPQAGGGPPSPPRRSATPSPGSPLPASGPASPSCFSSSPTALSAPLLPGGSPAPSAVLPPRILCAQDRPRKILSHGARSWWQRAGSLLVPRRGISVRRRGLSIRRRRLEHKIWRRRHEHRVERCCERPARHRLLVAPLPSSLPEAAELCGAEARLSLRAARRDRPGSPHAGGRRGARAAAPERSGRVGGPRAANARRSKGSRPASMQSKGGRRCGLERGNGCAAEALAGRGRRVAERAVEESQAAPSRPHRSAGPGNRWPASVFSSRARVDP